MHGFRAFLFLATTSLRLRRPREPKPVLGAGPTVCCAFLINWSSATAHVRRAGGRKGERTGGRWKKHGLKKWGGVNQVYLL